MGRSPTRWLMFFLVGSIFMQTDVTSIQCHCTRGCSDGFFCKTGGQCEKGWSGPTCQNQNIALGKPTQQSSTANDCKWAGDDPLKRDHCGYKNSTLAVDGKTSSDYWSGHTCTHTRTNQQQAWWSVDLGVRHYINVMKIFFSNPNKNRMKNFRALVDDHLCFHWSKTWSPPTSPLLVTCDTKLVGQKVVIVSGRVTDVSLNLCEVEIYECSDGTFGADCSKQCHCRNVSEICNKSTGHCLSGCTAGYTGPGCNQECSDGKFGEDCNSDCFCRRPFEVCDRVTGWCDSGCPDGYHDIGCKKLCDDGKFGFNCSGTCGRCRHGGVCDKIEGECPGGCQDGLFEPFCQECKEGYYGTDCVKCGHCFGNRSCDKESGHCQGVCQPGWTGENCQTQKCIVGYYGPECVSCGYCTGNSTCDNLTGQCLDGCQAGWKGDNCQDVCDNGTYGLNCSGTCGRCQGDETCDKNDGSCSNGCQEGFTTPLCQACTDGYYGSDCVRCGQCLGNSSCDKLTGRCLVGCNAGWKGDNCEEVSNEEKVTRCNGVSIRFVIIAVSGVSLMSSLGTCMALAIRRRTSSTSSPKQCDDGSAPHLNGTVTNREFKVLEKVEYQNDDDDHVYVDPSMILDTP